MKTATLLCAALVAATFAAKSFAGVPSDQTNVQANGAFDGGRFYAAAVEAVAKDAYSLSDPHKRQQWLALWRTRFDGTNQLDTEGGAVEGVRQMLSSLGMKFDVLLDPDQVQQMDSARNAGKPLPAGIGVELVLRPVPPDGPPQPGMRRPADTIEFVVRRVFDGGPADGILRPGDAIIKAGCKTLDLGDGEGCLQLSSIAKSDVGPLLQGQEGSAVVVEVRRDGISYRFSIVKARYRVSVVSMRSVSGIPYLRIENFLSAESAEDTMEAERKALAFSSRMLILDLRNNRGGLAEEAMCVAATMLPEGTLMETRRRVDDAIVHERIYIDSSHKLQLATLIDGKPASAEELPLNCPLLVPPAVQIAVLVNAETGSASEFLVGALKANKRAVVIGAEATMGKGEAQVDRQLPGGYRLVLTILEFLPGGQAIKGKGVQSDVVVDESGAGDAVLDEATRRLSDGVSP